MALAKKCDRCGKFYDHYPIDDTVRQYNAVRTIQKKFTGETKNSHAAYDLCPECMASFAHWFKNEPMTFNEIRNTVGLEPIRDCDDVAMEWIRLFSEKEKKNNAEN